MWTLHGSFQMQANRTQVNWQQVNSTFYNFKENEGSYGESHVRSKVVDKNTTTEINMLELKETIDRLASANGVRWYGHVLKRNDNSILRVARDLEVSGKRKQGRTKKTWKKLVEEETKKIGLKEDTLN